MCGFACLVNIDGQSVTVPVINKMTDAVSHRGPDNRGIFIERNVALGHRRLAIVDITNNGNQPMFGSHRNYVVVFNGEIYNFLELRNELVDLGYVFNTKCDTEVLLAAYAEWGQSCVKHFNGMWAFALYDRKTERIFCSRDRFGEKPFYYVFNKKIFACSSEIRQLLPFLPARRADSEVLIKFIIGSISEEIKKSFFKDIQKLQGGHNLTLDIRNGSIFVEQYYKLKVDKTLACINESEQKERLSAALVQSVRLRLRSDVKLGTCLSGGLDSSSIATLAAMFQHNESREPFIAITACSEQKENDESEFAKQIVKQNKLKWHKVRPTYNDFVMALPSVVKAQEEPFPSASIAMQFFVMKSAREQAIRVLLDGQGGDETLLGYERYFASHYLNKIRKNGFLKMLADTYNNNANMTAGRVFGYFAYFNSARIRWLNYRRLHKYLKSFPEMFEEIRMYADASRNIQSLQILEIERTSLPALLRFEDKNAMWHSVETRLPFLDYRLVELALSLPNSAKISEGWTKHVLRRAMADKMPDGIVWRRNKFGFEAPERLWFARHRSAILEAVHGSALLASVCRHDQLRRGFGKLDALTQWRLYSVACWERAFEVVI